MTTDSLFTLNLGEEVTLTDDADDTNVKTSSSIKYGPDSGPFTLIESEPKSDRTTVYYIKYSGVRISQQTACLYRKAELIIVSNYEPIIRGNVNFTENLFLSDFASTVAITKYE